MTTKIKQFLFVLVLLVVLILPYFVFATEGPINMLEQVQPNSGYQEQTGGANNYTFAIILGRSVRILLSLLGIIFIIMMLYGGYHYMTAGGDESKVEKSRKTIQRAIIGLVILLSSYTIWNFIRIYMDI